MPVVLLLLLAQLYQVDHNSLPGKIICLATKKPSRHPLMPAQPMRLFKDTFRLVPHRESLMNMACWHIYERGLLPL